MAFDPGFTQRAWPWKLEDVLASHQGDLEIGKIYEVYHGIRGLSSDYNHHISWDYNVIIYIIIIIIVTIIIIVYIIVTTGWWLSPTPLKNKSSSMGRMTSHI